MHHEIAGVIEALDPGVEGWQTGARVGVGWYALQRAAEAYDRMMSGGARFRVVLKMDGSPTGRS